MQLPGQAADGAPADLKFFCSVNDVFFSLHACQDIYWDMIDMIDHIFEYTKSIVLDTCIVKFVIF
jgi:hypothetical protein